MSSVSAPKDPITIVGSARTPIGGFQGALAACSAPELGAVAIRAALERAEAGPEDVGEVTMGCVLPAGVGQAPARQASLQAGVPDSVPCATVNKVCGSGMKAAMLAHDALAVGAVRLAVAGGMESMTNAPYLLAKARRGLRLGHGEIHDHMFLDGLEDAYGESSRGRLMGTFAEDTAQELGFSREEQDEFAIESLARAKRANEDGTLSYEIEPVVVRSRKGETEIARDEQPFTATPEKIPNLRPAFRENGTVTAANSSSISDGAAALVLTKASSAGELGLAPMAKIVGHATHAREPRWFTTAPIGAISELLETVGWQARDVDLWEINEAFAVVTLAAMREFDLDHQRVNVHGGACAIGHPIGASGARILVTLVSALRQRSLVRGVASLCIGGGEATAMAVEITG